MKKKKNVLIGVAVLVLLGIILFIFFITSQDKNLNFNQKVNNMFIEDAEAENGIELKKGKIVESNGLYYIYMTAINNTKKDIDMSNYRISFRDSNDNEIEFFMGSIIGEIKPSDSVDFVVESYQNLNNVSTIYYEVFN